ncbi:hypothetical protein NK356_14645 [Chryseobacterium sp. S0630]|uniref:hypothetical protein n=1 Tax=Chryseobacterium sp. S0630 TaxID=2957803 RepID=UPI0020A08AF9|nr:hypothetical protein [Chryseobacterium sp. S0630]MCP1300412.1 hypothetical protein [Chryseobacterium sp. S0630]
MKKIIAATFLVLVLTLYNYPVYDDKKITFAIIFLCCVVLIFSIAKLYSPEEKGYDSFEKEMDSLHTFDGIFEYTKDGFYFKQNNGTEFVKWDEIISVYSFSIPSPFANRQSGLEIITGEKTYEFDDKVTLGIVKLEDQLSTHLPTWELDSPTVKMNNFGLKKTKLYEKNLL